MSLTLDATLQTAQDGLIRNPILSLVSSQIAADIPFDGELLTSETNDESAPNVIMHSTGRLCFVFSFAYSGSYYKVIYGYTDVDRKNFYYSEGYYGTDTVLDCSLCELADGNIGIITLTETGANYWLKYRTMSVTGVTITNDNIQGYAKSSYWIGSPYVIKLANDTYLLIYGHKTGGTYTLEKRTSSNFTSWSSGSTISISGLTTARRWDNPQLLQVTDGDIFLSFDFVDEISGSEERINCYYSISPDNGATWGAAVAITTYSTFGTIGGHPFAAQKTADTMDMTFTEQTGALHIDDSSNGWCSGFGKEYYQNLHFDSVTRKLYAQIRAELVSKSLGAVLEIDVDNWTITGCWNCATVPAYNGAYCANNCSDKCHGERYLSVMVCSEDHVAILNAEADTITTYDFTTWAGYSITKNVDSDLNPNDSFGAWIDFDSNRCYFCFAITWGVQGRKLYLGYFDLLESGPTYSFTLVLDGLYFTQAEVTWFGWFLDVSNDLIFCLHGMYYGAAEGFTKIYTLSTGALWKTYQKSSFAGYPMHGLRQGVLVNNKLYGLFSYESGYGEQDKRGLCEIDLDTDVITMHRPSWASVDDYKFMQMEKTDDNKIIITTYGYGITVFDTNTNTWELFDNDSVPGLTEDGTNYFNYVAYDNAGGQIFAGSGAYGTGSWYGIVMFSQYGLLKRSYYKVGTNAGGWSFGSANPLVLGNVDYEAAITYDPDDDGMYILWTNRDVEELSIKWDKESGAFDLTPYVVREDEVIRKSSIDGSPNRLEFSVSEGHLFDPHNQNSLWRSYLEKSRKITMKLGEIISDTNYWQDQGEFYVTSMRLSYERGKYPIVKVVAEDIRALWRDMTIIATEYYESAPVAVLEDLIPTHTTMLLADVDLPAFDPSTNIYIQWLETEFDEIHKQICNRFGYYPRITVEGKYSARKISNGNAVDHTYSDSSFLINFTPDDDYSDFTNKIIVQGEENTFIEVVFAEEKILSMTGTVGWWGFQKDFTKYYSEDKERRCRDPRLKVIESSASIAFELAGKITESISSVDDDEQYCVVTVEAPDLTPILVTAIAGLAGSYAVPGWGGDVIRTSALILALQVLAAIGNYQYEIWAQPLGKVRRSVQYVADDTELQNKLGFEVTKVIKDPLCFSVSECAYVANHELMIGQMQRNRVRFSKIAHLQDEEGDTLRLPHPYTSTNMDIFVTDLTRRFKIPEAEGSEGYVIDDIEGWKI